MGKQYGGVRLASRRRALWILLLAAAWWPRAAEASVVRALSVAQQVALSDAVVEGRVGVAEAHHEPGSPPFTDVPIHVEQVLHARVAVPEVVWLRQRRGVVEGRRITVVGDAVLQPGEHVVVFLRQVQGRWYLTSLAQSVFWLDGAFGPGSAEQRLGGLTRLGEDGATPLKPPPGAATSAESLRRAVRAAGVRP